MDVRHLKRLIRLVEQSEINELEVEDGGTRVKIVKSGPAVPVHVPVPAAEHARPAAAGLPPAEASGPPALDESKLIVVTSPMVGTFYRAPSPGAPSFVEVGQNVSVGQTLCILEAMKLMNELQCEAAGVIREICVENAQPVEFGQRLFLIEP
ncbi:MAG: acetyl-CoA carboxylase biotin carboxyl carrier protein [Candidatus Glassbacteria bacterium]|nr:acetyl-CoA carboxylase biotin carboxyl carrier protein [Candidatus Glassbacteria bacterium]